MTGDNIIKHSVPVVISGLMSGLIRLFFEPCLHQVIGWLLDGPIDCFIDWLVDRLIARVANFPPAIVFLLLRK